MYETQLPSFDKYGSRVLLKFFNHTQRHFVNYVFIGGAKLELAKLALD